MFQVEKVAAPLRLQVLQSIRTAIAVGHFKPGERLTERDLCEMTGVSRSLIRETLRQLETEGLITVVPHRGPVVAQVTVEKAKEIYLVRCELEALACGLFAENASDDDQRALRTALKTLKAVMGKPDIAARLRAKDEFYECLLRGTRNETLADALNMLNSRVTLLRATSLQAKGRGRDSIAELTRLVDALEARDADTSRRLAREHVQNAGRTAVAILAAADEAAHASAPATMQAARDVA